MHFHARAVPHLRPQLPNQQSRHLQNHHRSSPPRRAKIRTRRFSCCCSTSGFAVAGKTTQVKPPALALGASCLILFSQSMPTLAKIILFLLLHFRSRDGSLRLSRSPWEFSLALVFRIRTSTKAAASRARFCKVRWWHWDSG